MPISDLKLTHTSSMERQNLQPRRWTTSDIEIRSKYPVSLSFVAGDDNVFANPETKESNQATMNNNGKILTYPQLQSKIYNLAAHLMMKRQDTSLIDNKDNSNNGNGTPLTIAVFLEFGIDFIISIMSILKAGCTFVIINPALHVSEIHNVLEKSKAGIIIMVAERGSDNRILEMVKGISNLTVVNSYEIGSIKNVFNLNCDDYVDQNMTSFLCNPNDLWPNDFLSKFENYLHECNFKPGDNVSFLTIGNPDIFLLFTALNAKMQVNIYNSIHSEFNSADFQGANILNLDIDTFKTALLNSKIGRNLRHLFISCTETEFDQICNEKYLYLKLNRSEIENQVPSCAKTNGEFTFDPEMHKILVDWNNTGINYPENRTMHSFVESQAEEIPNTPAIIAAASKGYQIVVTYQELNRRANQLAHWLVQKGVQAEMPVAILLEDRQELIIASLAILKAGGAFVPLCTDYPVERLRYILADLGHPFLVTSRNVMSKLALKDYQGDSTKLIFICESTTANTNLQNLTLEIKSSNLAYIIYTSGSTGNPKGVMVEHRSVVNMAHWYIRMASLSSDGAIRATLYLNPAFDASIFETWPYLFSGGTLYIAPKEARINPQFFIRWLNEFEINFTALPTTFAESVIKLALEGNSSSDSNYPRFLRKLLVGGETLSSYPFSELPFEVVNCYGPTEVTVLATCMILGKSRGQGQDKGNLAAPPIGIPIDNVQVYVLDEHKKPVSVGVKGELYIGGAGISRGYFNREELTKEKFILNTFDQNSERLYKSGDLVQWLPNGNLEFLGRTDDQVKIRGFRVEPSEIQVVLEKHEIVKKAIVLVHAQEQDGSKKELVAYVVAPNNSATAPSEKLRQHMGTQLNEFLKQYFPSYMIPSKFVFLESFALTPNGKIDKKALQALSQTQDIFTERRKNFVVPSSYFEKILAEIWSSVLNRPLDKISVTDNFFELGGHSMLVLNVLNQTREKLGQEFPTMLLFQTPVLKDLADYLAKNVNNSEFSFAISSKNDENGTSAPLSFAQELIWLHMQQAEVQTPDAALYNETIILTMPGRLNIPALEQSIGSLIQTHQMLRANFKLKNGVPTQSWLPAQSLNNKIDIFILDLTHLSMTSTKVRDATIIEFLAKESQIPFDLTKNQLIRFLLIKCDAFLSKLCIIAHHLIVDGVSLSQVIIPDLVKNYKLVTGAGAEGLTSQIMNSKVTYTDYVIWQRQTPNNTKSLDFWKKTLSNLTVLDLPTDRLKPTTRSFAGAVYCLKLSKSLSEQLLILSQENQTTLYVTLLTALNILLYRYCNQEDITVCGVTSGRNALQGQCDKVIGHFTNILTLRNKISSPGSITLLELLKQIHTSTISAYEHQDYPFQKLIENGAYKAPNLGELPSPVIFSLEPTVEANNLGWTTNQFDVHTGLSKFDLTIRADNVIGANGGLIFQFEYRKDIFDKSTIVRMARHYETLLTSILDTRNEMVPISNLEILPEDEKEIVLYKFNDTQIEFPSEMTIHALFEEQARKTPDNIAISDVGMPSITYSQLNRRANRLANFLRAKIGSESTEPLIAVLLSRGTNFVVSVLAILKVGGAYVPLTEDYPLKRLEYILEDTSCKFLISNSTLLEKVGLLENSIRKHICLDELENSGSVLQNENTAKNLNLPIKSNNMAYIIYTSGSTGQPKGVMVEHRNVVNFSYWHIREGPVTEFDRTTLLVSPAFDVCLFEMCPYLFSGASLHVAPNDARFDAKILYEWLKSEQITMSYLPTALSEAFMKLSVFETESESIALRKLFIGGERLTFYPNPDLPFDVINCYGPTEVTVQSTAYNVRGCPKLCTNPSIGGPMDNVQVYVLDKELQPCPLGVIGEIYLGGAGVARGYLNRDDLTREKYIPNPFVQENENAKIYKSGDLARWLPNGMLDFKGRTDDQVKIRGFRIELGEIQTQLEDHAGVQTAIVLMKDKQLVAYVLPKEDFDKNSQKELKIEQVNQWQSLYEEMYKNGLTTDDTLDNSDEPSLLAGWTSSYTGEYIDQSEMREWVDATAARILSLNPKRILEIGSGSGLLFDKIISEVDHYVVTDFSLASISALTRRVKALDFNEKCTLYHRTGDTFLPGEVDCYDTVVINSVIQYFPDVSYLLKVLEGAVSAVKSGGSIFVGDIRSLSHLEVFHAEVQRHKVKSSATMMDWKTAVEIGVKNEEELIIECKFFEDFAKLNPKLSHATILMKEGRGKNEMNCFRYDVILHIQNSKSSNQNSLIQIPWQNNITQSINEVKNHLKMCRNEIVVIKGIPNARISSAVTLMEISTLKPNKNFSEIAANLSKLDQSVDPQDFVDLAKHNGLFVQMTWSEENPLRDFDAYFANDVRILRNNHIDNSNTISKMEPLGIDNLRKYVNNPLKNKSVQNLLQELKAFLKQRVPSFMIPSHWIFLDSIPLTSNGKIDKKALPNQSLISDFVNSASKYRQYPKTDTEEALLTIWAETLQRPETSISIIDSFFEIGGHSLMAAKLIEKIFKKFGVPIQFRSLFEFPTIQKLGEILERLKSEDGGQIRCETFDPDVIDTSVVLILLKPHSQEIQTSPRDPVYFIHPVGGTVFCYNSLVAHLGNDRSYYALQDPSIEADAGKILFSNISEMAEYYVKIIREFQPEGPYLLAGHSFGGFVAFEMAHILGKRVSQVFLLDSWRNPPKLESETEANKLEQNLIKYHEQIKREKYKKFDLPNVEKWIQLGSHRYQMGLNYKPKALGSEVKVIAFKAEISYFQSVEADETSWNSFCGPSVDIHLVPGDHDSILIEPNVNVLAEKMKLYLH